MVNIFHAGPIREKISSLKNLMQLILNGKSKNFENIEKQIKKIIQIIQIFKTK